MCRIYNPTTGKYTFGSCVFSPFDVEFRGSGGARQFNACINLVGPGQIHGLVPEVSKPLAVFAADPRIRHLGGPMDLLTAAGVDPVGEVCQELRRYKPERPGFIYAGHHDFRGLVTARLHGEGEVKLAVCLHPTATGHCGAIKGTTTTLTQWVEQFGESLQHFSGPAEVLELFGLVAVNGRCRSRARTVPSA
ncbi:MAG: hypothetical protein WC497_00285 [Patescibacteria group bacterium]